MYILCVYWPNDKIPKMFLKVGLVTFSLLLGTNYKYFKPLTHTHTHTHTHVCVYFCKCPAVFPCLCPVSVLHENHCVSAYISSALTTDIMSALSGTPDLTLNTHTHTAALLFPYKARVYASGRSQWARETDMSSMLKRMRVNSSSSANHTQTQCNPLTQRKFVLSSGSLSFQSILV